MNYFVTMGDSRFFLLIYKSVENALRLHPELPIVIYDWGLKKDQKKALEDLRCCVIPWSFISNPVSFHEKLNRHEWLLCQKPYCYKNFIRRFKSPFLFLDGDAYMIKRIPELINCKEDIGVTVRREEDQDFRYGQCRVINSGVFKLNNLDLVDKWIERMEQTKERLVEQTALTRMLYDGNKFTYKKFPCEIYNYYWVEKDIPDTARILHLKGKGTKRRQGYK